MGSEADRRLNVPSRLAAAARPWRLLPAYAVNGIETAVGIGCIQLAVLAAAGPHVSALVVSGAVCASIADLPNVPSRTWHRVGTAALLAALASLVVDLLRLHPLALGIAIGAVGFVAMMTLAWGARAGAVSFAPILAMIFSMAVPPAHHALAVAGWSALGSFLYLGWALFANNVLQRRYRTLALTDALHAAAQLFLARSEVLASAAEQRAESPPRSAWLTRETALADRLQAARDLLFPAPENPLWCRDVGILLRVIDLRDGLLASRLDVDLLGSDVAGRIVLDRAARALGGVGEQLDAVALAVRDGRREAGWWPHPRDLASLPEVVYDVRGIASVPAPPIAASDARARLLPALQGRLDRLGDDMRRVHRLLRGELEPLPLTHAQLQRFVAPEGWPIRALRPHWRRDSLVLRHAIRMALALATAYTIGVLLPWGSHPYWLVLSVAVVLRGSLGDTLARRNGRVVGTVLGCLLVVAFARVPSASFQGGIFLVALGTAHAFVIQRYWLTATAASVMALLQSHLVNPAGGFAIAERIADTFLGAALAWSFSFVLPSWERRNVPQTIARVLRDLRGYASHSLRAGSGDALEERMARRTAYESLSALGAALQRSRVEPKGVRLPVEQIASLLDHGERFMAHLSLVRHSLARLEGASELPRIDSALASTVAALDRAFAPIESATPSAIDAELATEAAAGAKADADAVEDADAHAGTADALDVLPAQPPIHDIVPWLQRRLSQMAAEAAAIRSVARRSSAA